MKKKLSICFYIFTALSFFAQEAASIKDNSEKQADKNAVKFTTKISVTAVYPWAGLLEIAEEVKVPVLNLDNPLTKDNNLTTKFALILTPVTLESDFSVSFTPVAFLKFYAGGGIGSGWKLNKFHGFSKNINNGNLSEKEDIKFKDFFFSNKFGGVFQFDLGAVIDNKWAHVVTLVDQGVSYMGSANMTPAESWFYRDDDGENRNGWTYKAAYVLGYQMPIPMDLIGIQIETEKKLYKNEKKHLWGDNLMKITLTPLMDFKVTEYFHILLFAQWHTVKNYIYANGERNSFYELNTINSGKKQNLKFKRAGFTLNFSIKNN